MQWRARQPQLSAPPPHPTLLPAVQLRSGKPAGDADVVADLLLKPGAKVMMMG